MKTFLILIVQILGILMPQNAMACTAFCLRNENQVVVGKNLDWEIDLGYLFINEAGQRKTAFTASEEKLIWISKYRSITFNQLGKELPLGGLNEKGLVVEELNMPSKRLSVDSTKHSLNEFQFVQFLLDNYKSVEEIVIELNSIQLRPMFQSLHYLVADHSATCLIIEDNGYGFDYYVVNDKEGYPVLSNNPYPASLHYLKNFQGFGGEMPVLNRQGSNERFVSVANMLDYNNSVPIVHYSFAILDTVKQPDTRWSIVYDITNLKIYFKFHSCQLMKTIDFIDVIRLSRKNNLGSDISNCGKTAKMIIQKISASENKLLIESVLKKLELNADDRRKLVLPARLSDYSNHYLMEPVTH